MQSRNKTRDEQAVALLSRIYPDSTTECGKAETLKLMGDVRRNHPGLLDEMRPSDRQLRNAQTKYGLEPPAGKSLSALPILNVKGPLVNAAIKQFSRKLFCALFYKHAGDIVCASGGIGMRWFANVQISADDQFFYRWGITETKRMGAFIAFFRESFAIFGVVHQDSDQIDAPESSQVIKPYKWV
jgi:hypothetical protein